MFTKNVELLIIGRNPGLEHSYADILEAEFMNVYQQRYPKSRIGKYIEKHLGKSVWEKTAITNVCKCSSPKNSTLKSEEIERCVPYLISQIKIFSPKAILLFGKEAATLFFENKASEILRSDSVIRYTASEKSDTIHIAACFHPSYISRLHPYAEEVDFNILKMAKIRKVLDT